MPITTMDALVAALPGQHLHFMKDSAASQANTWRSFWAVGGFPAAGANPTALAGAVPTKDTIGALPFANAAAPALSHLARFISFLGSAGMVYLCDRLWHGGPVSATVNTLQTVNSVALTRPDSLGADTELWLEVTTAPGATAANLTVNYTNQAGVAKTTTVALPPSAVVGRMTPVPLAAGDTGIRSIQSVQASAANTAGAFNLVILRCITEVASPGGGVSVDRDAFAIGMPRVHDNACLGLVCLTNAAATGVLTGSVQLVQG